MNQTMEKDVKDLEQLLEHMEQAVATDHSRVTVQAILDAIGSRSFAPLLMLVGVLIASPLSGIPGFPTFTAMIIVLVAVQMLVGRKQFWLPAWLLARSVARDKMAKAIRWLKPGARLVDRFIRPRLTVLVKGPAQYLIALICLAIAAAMPVMELVPFSSSAAGATLSAFGLALVACDGALALLAYLVTGMTLWLVLLGLL